MDTRRGELTYIIEQMNGKIDAMYNLARGMLYYPSSLKQDILEMYQKEKQDITIKQLEEMPLEVINSQKEGYRITSMKKAGYSNIWQVCNARQEMLSAINGISEEGAGKILEKCRSIYDEVFIGAVFRVNYDARNEQSDKLVQNLYCLKHVDIDTYLLNFSLRVINECASRLSLIYDQVGPLKWLFKSRNDKAMLVDALREIFENVTWHERKIQEQRQKVDEIINQSKEKAWDDYLGHAADYQAELESIVGVLDEGRKGTKKVKLWDYFTPQYGSYDIEQYGDDVKALVDKVNAFPLQTGFMRATLRRYQTFGTKYILNQKRTLLGDEMGLGKTLQAIAAMAHLKESGKTTFLVVCPLSVLINWTREVEKHTLFGAIAIYGDDWDEEFEQWQKEKGVAITTYETLRKMDMNLVENIDMLVVDEAHYVKNKESKRTGDVLSLVEKSEYVLYMTGTPIENKVSEMIYLISCLNEGVAKSVEELSDMRGAQKYRVAVSPVYLRRTREDVLRELPELIEIEDWMFLNEQELEDYKACLTSGTIMDARRVSWHAPQENSGKLAKLLEICKEAEEDGRKILVFSFFLDTIQVVQQALGERGVGVITGDVSGAQRQEILDSYAKAGAGSVLVCQIQAGGVGLNIQAASVVVFCEPQYKPSVERQAVARAYRMGQARNVFVHRLLMKDTVDERIMGILHEKALVFDSFANTSEVGEIDNDINEKDASADIMKKEIEKYGIERENMIK